MPASLPLAGASLASYTLLFSWQFAVVIMAVIFVHEYTHVLVMKRFKIRVKGTYFIPFIGAAAVPDDDSPTEWRRQLRPTRDR